MKPHFVAFFFAALLLLTAATPPGQPGVTELQVQTRAASNQILAQQLAVDPSKVAILVIDMWNYHWCKTCSAREASLIPRMNQALAGARKLGMKVFWAPTDEVLPYHGTPQRERAAAVPYVDVPAKTREFNIAFSGTGGVGSCMCGPGISCRLNYGMNAQHPDLVVAPEDYFIDSSVQELYSLCKRLGITHVIYMGIATNICVVGKPPALKNLYEVGIDCLLARDATDAFTGYEPGKHHPDQGTATIVADLERKGIPTINMGEEMRRLHVVDDAALTEPVRMAPWGKPDDPYLFEESTTVTLSTPWLRDVTYHYTLDGGEPTPASTRYTQPVSIRDTCVLRAIAFREGKPVSLASSGHYVRLGAKLPPPDVGLAERTRIMTAPERYTWMPGINEAFDGHPLTLRGRKYDHGIGCRAPTELLYDLSTQDQRFVALAGIDDGFLSRGADPKPGVSGRRVASFAKVIFKVFVDGEIAAASPIMRVSSEPWRFDVPLPAGAQRLSLVVNSVDRPHPLDCGNWVNAGFIRRNTGAANAR